MRRCRTLKPNGRAETGTRSGVWFHNKPTDLSACVSEEGGHGEGGVSYATLLSDTLKPNDHVGTGMSPGVWLRNKPMDQCVCFIATQT